jgi:hypothetical protein
MQTMTKIMDTFPSYLTPHLPALFNLVNCLLPAMMPLYQSVAVQAQGASFTVIPGWEGASFLIESLTCDSG